MTWPRGLAKIEKEMERLGYLERMVPNPQAVQEWIDDASRHLRSATRLADDDPRLAYAACHDAIRKALTALLAQRGLRPKGGEGGHVRIIEWGAVALAADVDGDILDALDLIRRQRHVAEYGELASQVIGSPEVVEAIRVADQVVAGAKTLLKRESRGERTKA
jgi:HEPN domain-containing protein